MKVTKYTEQEQEDMIREDLLRDAACSEEQAANGPFYPEKGITRESLLAHASECRTLASRHNWTVKQFISGQAYRHT